jgi:hypothetical protein
MTTGHLADEHTPWPGLEPEPMIETCIALVPGMQVCMDPCVGDRPLVEFISGRARLLIYFGVESSDLNAEHLALAEEFAVAASRLYDEVRHILEAREFPSGTEV